MEQQRYKELLEILSDASRNVADHIAAKNELMLWYQGVLENHPTLKDDFDHDKLKAALAKKMQGERAIDIEGDIIDVSLERLLEDAIEYYSSLMAYPEVYIMNTPIEQLYQDVYLYDN